MQRVESATVSVDGRIAGAISRGFLCLVGVTHADTEQEAARLAAKTARLRVFEDEDGLMNLALAEVDGEVLAVPQFTLYADASRGNRPSFSEAAPPTQGASVFEAYVQALRAEAVPVQTGVFGAHMRVELVNDGPVTILLES